MHNTNNPGSSKNEIVSTSTQPETRSIPPASGYVPDSIWTNIRYGSGMLAFIVVPPLIPGASVRILIIGYMVIIVSIYIAAGVMTVIRARHPMKGHRRGGG